MKITTSLIAHLLAPLIPVLLFCLLLVSSGNSAHLLWAAPTCATSSYLSFTLSQLWQAPVLSKKDKSLSLYLITGMVADVIYAAICVVVGVIYVLPNFPGLAPNGEFWEGSTNPILLLTMGLAYGITIGGPGRIAYWVLVMRKAA